MEKTFKIEGRAIDEINRLESMNRIMEQREKDLRGRPTSHDDHFRCGEFNSAAVAYIYPNAIEIVVDNQRKSVQPPHWPFGYNYFKPNSDDRMEDLARAGAFILAEMERIQREEMKEKR